MFSMELSGGDVHPREFPVKGDDILFMVFASYVCVYYSYVVIQP